MAAVKFTLRVLLGILLIGFVGFHFLDIILLGMIRCVFEGKDVFVCLLNAFISFIPFGVISAFIVYGSEDYASIRVYCVAIITSFMIVLAFAAASEIVLVDVPGLIRKIPPSYMHSTWGEIKRHPDYTPVVTHIIYIFHILLGFIIMVPTLALSAIVNFLVVPLIAFHMAHFVFYGTFSENEPSSSSDSITENKSKSKIITEIKKIIRKKH